MTQDKFIKLIRYLSTVISILEMKWERPQTGIEYKVIEQLKEVRRDLHIAYRKETGLQLPTGYEYPGSEIE